MCEHQPGGAPVTIPAPGRAGEHWADRSGVTPGLGGIRKSISVMSGRPTSTRHRRWAALRLRGPPALTHPKRKPIICYMTRADTAVKIVPSESGAYTVVSAGEQVW